MGETLLDLSQILQTLAKKRPIFHSEADFQHALAWQIHAVNPAASIRLELPVPVELRVHLDLLVESDQQRCAIELKYKTAAMTADVGGEPFSLLYHGAQDFGRYDFLKDVTRLERYVTSWENSIGHAIFLSNDSLYWKEAQPGITGAQFSIHHTREIHSEVEMRWAAHAGPGSTKGRKEPISFKSGYSCSWESYSMVNGSQFKYLILTVVRNKRGA
jgi:hypothetical protein